MITERFASRKYVLSFYITIGILVLVYILANFFYNQRIAQVKNIENNINQNILESEIQYALLADAACDADDESGSLFVSEMNNLATRLEYMENQRGTDDLEVINLKKSYSLLQIKDYLFLRERARQCGKKQPAILYFYSNEGDCLDCKKMGYVLTSMREDYDTLHIYAFDINLGLSTIQTLKSIYKMENNPPVLVIDRKPYYGFKSREEIENLIPDLALMKAQKTATSTKKK